MSLGLGGGVGDSAHEALPQPSNECSVLSNSSWLAATPQNSARSQEVSKDCLKQLKELSKPLASVCVISSLLILHT